MKRQRITSLLIAAAVAVLAFGALVGSGAAKSRSGDDDGREGRSFHGNVSTVFAKQRAFTVKRANGSTMRFVVRPTTTYEHISGFSGLRKGVPVEVHAVNPNGRWVATRIETNPGGSGGGSDDPPGDDHGSGGHGADDPPGDDHGSGGHGADD